MEYYWGTSSDLLYRPSCLPLELVILGWVELVLEALEELVLALGWEAGKN